MRPYSYLILITVITFILIGKAQNMRRDNVIPNPSYQTESGDTIIVESPTKDQGVLIHGNTQNLDHFFKEDSTLALEAERPTVTGTLPHQSASVFVFTVKNRSAHVRSS